MTYCFPPYRESSTVYTTGHNRPLPPMPRHKIPQIPRVALYPLWSPPYMASRTSQLGILACYTAYQTHPYAGTHVVDTRLVCTGNMDPTAYKQRQQSSRLSSPTRRRNRPYLCGMLVKQWAEVQHQYYLWLNRHTTGQRWLARLILKLWEIAWDLWSHRYMVMTSPNSFAMTQLHLDLDDSILRAYDVFTPDPPLHLARWFSQPLPSVLSESLEFKRQWLDMIHTLTHGH